MLGAVGPWEIRPWELGCQMCGQSGLQNLSVFPRRWNKLSGEAFGGSFDSSWKDPVSVKCAQQEGVGLSLDRKTVLIGAVEGTPVHTMSLPDSVPSPSPFPRPLIAASLASFSPALPLATMWAKHTDLLEFL